MFVGFINSVMMKMTPNELSEVPKTKGEFCKLNMRLLGFKWKDTLF